MEGPIAASTHCLSPSSLLTSMSPEADVKPHLKMQDFTKPRTETLMVRKPVKKRKSWGQQLPEPKTDLAPRKRAKTEDEKEQRRIERIKRNRAAAHNSRERKRVEAEHLANANDVLLQRIQTLQRRLALQDAQLEKCKELLPDGLPDVPEKDVEYDRDYFPGSPASSAFTIDPRASLGSHDSSSPVDSLMIKLEEDISNDSTLDSIEPHALPALSFDNPTRQSDSHNIHGLDPTQHSAAMLCDLQCRSSPQSPLSTRQILPWTYLMIIMATHTTIMDLYRTSMLALWTRFPRPFNHYMSTTTTRPSTPAHSRTSSTLTHRRRDPLTFLLSAFTLLFSQQRTKQPSWSTLAQLLVATGLASSVSSAQALEPVLRELVGWYVRGGERLVTLSTVCGAKERAMSGGEVVARSDITRTQDRLKRDEPGGVVGDARERRDDLGGQKTTSVRKG